MYFFLKYIKENKKQHRQIITAKSKRTYNLIWLYSIFTTFIHKYLQNINLW